MCIHDVAVGSTFFPFLYNFQQIANDIALFLVQCLKIGLAAEEFILSWNCRLSEVFSLRIHAVMITSHQSYALSYNTTLLNFCEGKQYETNNKTGLDVNVYLEWKAKTDTNP